MNKYAVTWRAVQELWRDDGLGIDGDECSRQLFLRTLRDVSRGVVVGEATKFVLDEGVEYFDGLCRSGINTTDRLRAKEIADAVESHRVFEDDEFAAFAGLIAIHFDVAPKEPLTLGLD